MESLSEQKAALLKKWLEQTLATYPGQTLHFLESEKDRFRNPVGYTLREGLATLLDELTGKMNAAKIRPALESIVRLRAVQDFTPSQAVGFIYLLRAIFEEGLADEHRGGFTPPWRGEPAATGAGFAAMQKRIDETALLAFDLYMQCREEISGIKAREAHRKVYVLERMSQAK